MYQKVDKNNYRVYAHIFPDGKLYIGMTGLDIERRSNHGNGYMETPLFWAAIQEVGWENIRHIVLIEGINKEIARVCERELIIKYRSYDSNYGYNILLGGNHTEETKRKSGMFKNGYKPHIGFKHSAESRKKMSEAKKGKPLTEAQKAHLKRLNERNSEYWRKRRLKIENF